MLLNKIVESCKVHNSIAILVPVSVPICQTTVIEVIHGEVHVFEFIVKVKLWSDINILFFMSSISIYWKEECIKRI